LEVPAYLYDHGEVHNLSVRRGTITPEERYKGSFQKTEKIVR
jgi:hypothetical protein